MSIQDELKGNGDLYSSEGKLWLSMELMGLEKSMGV